MTSVADLIEQAKRVRGRDRRKLMFEPSTPNMRSRQVSPRVDDVHLIDLGACRVSADLIARLKHLPKHYAKDAEVTVNRFGIHVVWSTGCLFFRAHFPGTHARLPDGETIEGCSLAELAKIALKRGHTEGEIYDRNGIKTGVIRGGQSKPTRRLPPPPTCPRCGGLSVTSHRHC